MNLAQIALSVLVANACIQALRQWWFRVLDERFERRRPWLSRPRRRLEER